MGLSFFIICNKFFYQIIYINKKTKGDIENSRDKSAAADHVVYHGKKER